jgi:hypothetical protein
MTATVKPRTHRRQGKCVLIPIWNMPSEQRVKGVHSPMMRYTDAGAPEVI